MSEHDDRTGGDEPPRTGGGPSEAGDEVHPVERDEAVTAEAVAEKEGRTVVAVAEEEANRDDAGRGSDVSDGPDSWRLQGKIFGGVSVFMVVIATVYWFMSYEAAGTTFLVVSAAMTGLPALYLAWPRNRGGTVPARPEGHEEPGHDPHDGVWFPDASIWPLAIGVSMALIGNGFLLGRWLFAPALVLLAWSIGGMIRQGRHRL